MHPCGVLNCHNTPYKPTFQALLAASPEDSGSPIYPCELAELLILREDESWSSEGTTFFPQPVMRLEPGKVTLRKLREISRKREDNYFSL